MQDKDSSASFAASMDKTARDHGMGPIKKLVVAIHGIGSQARGETIRSVARQFGDRESLPVLPLGFFHIKGVGEGSFARLHAPNTEMGEIGFLEVFWADIPRSAAGAEENLLEEAKSWGRSVVSRARVAYNKKPMHNRQLEDADFDVGIGVVEEIVETIGVLENLCYLASKAGVFKFDLGQLLRDYVGDVQVVAEFQSLREEIVFRFHYGMAEVIDYFHKKREKEPDTRVPEIYVVAHSEGTVVSFLAMLQALSVRTVTVPPRLVKEKGSAPVSTEWIQHVRGFMTLGSPIDKHLLLWPALWTGFELKSAANADGSVTCFDKNGQPSLVLPAPIKWRNYYDLGDPVGFRLETAEHYLRDRQCAAFEFNEKHDLKFSRYLLPGKAHVDYWTDGEVFGHFIDDVVLPFKKDGARKEPVPPKSSWLIDKCSLAIPYLITFLIHLAAVYLLHKGITAFLGYDADKTIFLQVGLLGLLLMGITVSSRLPRLTKTGLRSRKLRWRLLAVIAFGAGAIPCYLWLPEKAANFIGAPFGATGQLAGSSAAFGKLVLVAGAAVLAASGWVLPRKARLGRIVLVIAGLLLAVGLTAWTAAQSDQSSAIWPTLLAGGAFVYLWWLGILMFDLTFIWHRYIRRSVAIEALDDWSCGRDARECSMLGFGSRVPAVDGNPQFRWQKES